MYYAWVPYISKMQDTPFRILYEVYCHNVLEMAATEASSGGDKPPNKLVVLKNTVHDFLHEKNSFTYVFELAEKYTKLPREYIFIGKLCVSLALLCD